MPSLTFLSNSSPLGHPSQFATLLLIFCSLLLLCHSSPSSLHSNDMRFCLLPFALLVAILSTLVQADACANGLTICGSGSISCSSYCTVKQNGKTRYFCRESPHFLSLSASKIRQLGLKVVVPVSTAPANHNCPQACVDIDSGSTTIPRCTGGGFATTSPVQSSAPASTPTRSQPPAQRCTFIRRLYRLC